MAALTDAQKIDCRRHLGYPLYGDKLTPGFAWRYEYRYLQFEYLMNNLQDGEVNVIVNLYLPNLNQLETDIYQVRQNSDTSQAAVWYRNKLELSERTQNYMQWQKRLSDFFGVPINSKPMISISMVV